MGWTRVSAPTIFRRFFGPRMLEPGQHLARRTRVLRLRSNFPGWRCGSRATVRQRIPPGVIRWRREKPDAEPCRESVLSIPRSLRPDEYFPVEVRTIRGHRANRFATKGSGSARPRPLLLR